MIALDSDMTTNDLHRGPATGTADITPRGPGISLESVAVLALASTVPPMKPPTCPFCHCPSWLVKTRHVHRQTRICCPTCQRWLEKTTPRLNPAHALKPPGRTLPPPRERQPLHRRTT